MEWETADGTATEPADYVAVSGATLRLSAENGIGKMLRGDQG